MNKTRRIKVWQNYCFGLEYGPLNQYLPSVELTTGETGGQFNLFQPAINPPGGYFG